MAQPYVGEIRMFAGNFAPAGWEFCSGQLLPISENEVLFQLIGTTYGGDGESTFALPNLQSRVPVHQGGNYQVGEAAGVEEVTLTTNQIPNHTHGFMVSTDIGNVPNPANAVVATSTKAKIFFSDPPSTSMAPNMVTVLGGSQPHTNIQPFLCINFIISLFGVFPSQT
ncbi:Microcystin-dependent protein [Dyadobacter sp. SG02]|uniref:phage tail protein n=1 Tax=Dyadobacter sp. SG02 TaxID=1855291 RepID=UPI0008CEFCA0|nr:tail fiber protein [Dyadobacter sp. SG02]SEJ01441.1 Microcystin-dependent protein [Dyadobacter sp. SG02]